MPTPIPRLERAGSPVGCSPATNGLPLMSEGSAPASNYRGLLRVHTFRPAHLHPGCARVFPEGFSRAIAHLDCSSGYRAYRQFPGRDLHPLAFETREVSTTTRYSSQTSFRAALTIDATGLWGVASPCPVLPSRGAGLWAGGPAPVFFCGRSCCLRPAYQGLVQTPRSREDQYGKQVGYCVLLYPQGEQKKLNCCQQVSALLDVLSRVVVVLPSQFLVSRQFCIRRVR
jgi:hypothetical protein